MRGLRIACVAIVCATAPLVIACSDDGGGSAPGDAGVDVTQVDASGSDVTQPPVDGGGDARADGGGGKLSDYVKELVTTQTGETQSPDKRVYDPWVEDEDTSAYPPAFFP